MTPILLNDLPEPVRTALEARAAERGLSLEAHIREVLQDSFLEPPRKRMNLAEAARKYFGPENGVDLDMGNHQSDRPIVDFSDYYK